MKLVELAPKWVTTNCYRRGMGLSFRCPHCDERLVIFFKNPLDGGNPDFTDRTLFTVKNSHFEDLTISPSIDAPDHWHGFIVNGEIIKA